MKFFIGITFSSILALIVGCSTNKGKVSYDVCTTPEAKEVVADFLKKKKYKLLPKHHEKIKHTDTSFVFEYFLNEEYRGGEVTIEVSKNNCQVVKSQLWQ